MALRGRAVLFEAGCEPRGEGRGRGSGQVGEKARGGLGGGHEEGLLLDDGLHLLEPAVLLLLRGEAVRHLLDCATRRD